MAEATLRDIFLLAAEFTHTDPDYQGVAGACMSIARAAQDLKTRKTKAKRLLYLFFGRDARREGPWLSYWGRNFADKPLEYCPGGLWWGANDLGVPPTAVARARQQARKGRVLMLLFLAEIAGEAAP